MAKLTVEQREKLAEADFADPKRRLFPVVDAEDVRRWALLAPRSPDPEAVLQNLAAIAKRKGLDLPASFSGGGGGGGAALAEVTFCCGAGGRPDADGHVVRPAEVVFRTGDHHFPEQGRTFSFGPEDVLALVAGWQGPVELEDTHYPSVFNGKLGHFLAPRPAADFSAFGGDVRLTPWVDALFPNEPLYLSAKFDFDTKTLKKVALVPNPRIGDAAAFSAAMVDAYAAFAGEQAAAPKSTPHGAGALQAIHDLSARAGAACGDAPGGDAGTADMSRGLNSRGEACFTAPRERKALQSIHDHSKRGGAKCDLYRPMGPDDAAGPLKTAQAAYAAYEASFAGPAAAPSARERELEAELARLRGAEDARRQAEEARAKAAAEAAFAARLDANGRAVDAFLASLGGAVTPFQKKALEADLRARARRAAEAPGEATFSDERGAQKTGSVLDQGFATAKALLAGRVDLTRELAPERPTPEALFSGDAGDAKARARAEADAALATTPEGRQLLDARKRAATRGDTNGRH